jgi:hypothetical protein
MVPEALAVEVFPFVREQRDEAGRRFREIVDRYGSE